MAFADPAEQRALITLSLISGLGAARVRALVEAFGSASRVLDASVPALTRISGIGVRLAETVAANRAGDRVDRQMELAAGWDASFITLWDEAYPPLLREIYDPPVFLWFKGRLEVLTRPSLSIVGTRRATAYGRQIARSWTRELVERGWVITSGLAYGIDAVAHRTALEAGGHTLAVLGSGLDRMYPSEHRALARSIVEQGGLLTEFPFGTKPDAVNFPRRNRIVSGLSAGTLVVEAYETGGALITARLAAEQNREVFAVPSGVDHPAGLGCNLLIQRAHARLVLSVDDMVAELPGGGAERERAEAVPPVLSGIERALYETLSREPHHIDRICAAAGTDASTALVYLLSLEVKGLVIQMAGKHFYRVE